MSVRGNFIDSSLMIILSLIKKNQYRISAASLEGEDLLVSVKHHRILLVNETILQESVFLKEYYSSINTQEQYMLIQKLPAIRRAGCQLNSS